MERRKLLQSAVAALILPWFSTRALGSTEVPSRLDYTSDISIILPPRQNSLPTGESLDTYQYRLYRAVLDFIHDHYSGKAMPVWKKPPEEVDLETRISNIVYWVVHSVQKQASTYFIDPVWIMAQIMEESFFYEYAVSWSFAAGICQFTLPTAESFEMTTPETRQAKDSELRHPEKAEALDRLRALRKRQNKLRSKNRKLFRNRDELFKESLRHHANGTSLPRAQAHLDALGKMDSLEQSMRKSRKEYMGFLRNNYRDRSIFNRKDLDFLLRFDERVTYKKPIEAMIRMMAQYMRGRNGNVLVATAGYNAGLSRTYYPYAVYKPYGRIPNFDETVSYVSKIAVNHFEIVQRLS